MSIRVTVVVATYRRPQLLVRCIAALAAQDFDPSEYDVIIVSDGPDDLTEKAFYSRPKAPCPNFTYLHTPTKKGPAAARNYGWQHAKGTLIAFTDDDCIPGANWIKSFYEQYQPGQDMAFTGKTIVPLPHRPTDYELNTAGLQTADFITANCCVTRNALQLTGGLDERFTMAWREDSDLHFNLLTHNLPIVKVPGAIVTHPVRNARWGISIGEQKKTLFNALLYKKHPALYRKHIRQITPLKYYGIITGFMLMLYGLLFGEGMLWVYGFVPWFGLTLNFILKRLRKTRPNFSHIMEMVLTSLLIPFLSVYWQWYGAVKYGVWFV